MEVRVSTPERVLVIGDATTTARIKRKFAYDAALNAVVTGRLSPDPDTERRGDGLLGSLYDLPTVVIEHRVERLVVASAQLRRDDLLEVVRLAKACGVKVAVLPPLLEVIGSDRADVRRSAVDEDVRPQTLRVSSSCWRVEPGQQVHGPGEAPLIDEGRKISRV